MSRVDGPVQREAMAAYLAAGRAAPGSREARGRAAADGFESTFIQNMLESVFSGLGEEGPLGSGSAGGGAWRGFYAEELSKSMAKGGGFGIAPAVYREMFRAQEITRTPTGKSPPATRTEGVTRVPARSPT